MPSYFDTHQLRAGAPDFGATLRFRRTPMQAHDKENAFAPAMVSQEERRSKAARCRDGGCRISSTE
jgi:hypothetical protein